MDLPHGASVGLQCVNVVLADHTRLLFTVKFTICARSFSRRALKDIVEIFAHDLGMIYLHP